MKAQFSHVYWGRVVLTGVLVNILIIILSTVLFWLAVLVWGLMNQPHLATQAASLISTILAIMLTVYGAVRVARKVESEARLHGFLVGLIAALILFFFGLALSGRLDTVTLVTFVLMVAAGWLGGVLGGRVPEQS